MKVTVLTPKRCVTRLKSVTRWDLKTSPTPSSTSTATIRRRQRQELITAPASDGDQTSPAGTDMESDIAHGAPHCLAASFYLYLLLSSIACQIRTGIGRVWGPEAADLLRCQAGRGFHFAGLQRPSPLGPRWSPILQWNSKKVTLISRSLAHAQVSPLFPRRICLFI